MARKAKKSTAKAKKTAKAKPKKKVTAAKRAAPKKSSPKIAVARAAAGTRKFAMGEERIRIAVQRTNKETKQIDVVEVEVTERDAAAANRALELLGKTEELRLFSDRSKDDHPDGTGATPVEEAPRATGADHLAELARRYGRGLAVVEGGLGKPTKAAQ